MKRPRPYYNLIGEVFGKLTVISEHSHIGKRRRWNCRCECGNEKTVEGSNLRGGAVKSCGCLRDGHPTHRMSCTAIYKIWKNIKERCYNKTCRMFRNYGGKGIVMCDRWLNSFENFYADMGPRPSNEYSIDRYPNPSGNYEPGNCRWATDTQQARNKVISRMLTLNGVTLNIHDWADRTGIAAGTIKQRLKMGWTIEQALTTPKLKGWNRHVKCNAPNQ